MVARRCRRGNVTLTPSVHRQVVVAKGCSNYCTLLPLVCVSLSSFFLSSLPLHRGAFVSSLGLPSVSLSIKLPNIGSRVAARPLTVVPSLSLVFHVSASTSLLRTAPLSIGQQLLISHFDSFTQGHISCAAIASQPKRTHRSPTAT